MGMLPCKSIDGEHVFLTGAGSGIGRLMAIKLASHGAKITCADIDLDSAQETASIVGENAFAVKCDVTNVEDIS